ncbi:MAG: site-specific integrase [Candidatus Devosia phytovorans]|uniref:Site-specific integrase n=1 Tax=Candidatus Devosia phytovorans TaxID=3121372 RepID=A0AAJ6AY79_9HYPH|nr:site-specific integrase [Devosia sp.]WEK03275.1 MAG: site-specific integrase [Devosia sp.]
MVLSMPRPYKHKATGVYWYRQRVPAHVMSVAKGQTVSVIVSGTVLRRTVGEALVVTLATKEPAEAKLRASAVQSQFDAIWIAFAKPPERLTLKEIVALAGEAFRGFQAFEDNPGDPEKWRDVVEANAAAFRGDPLYIGSASEKRMLSFVARFGPFVDAVLRTHQKRVDGHTYGLLLEHFGKALTDAANLLLKRAEGDFSPDDRGKKYPAVIRKSANRKSSDRGLTFDMLIDHKQKTQTRSARTFATYRNKVSDFARFIGHDDARQVTKDDVRRWRDDLIERGLARKTINDQYLAALKSVLAHGVKEFDLVANVAGTIRDERNDPAPKGSKDYTAEQARTILAATFRGVRKDVALPYRRAIFWAPWICAYTGLRVSEVTQLQGTSVLWEGGIPYLMIRPEDGGTKGGNAWTVGIHQHLIDLGLLDMFKAVGSGPAFYTPYPPGEDLSKVLNHRSKDAAERVAEWVRDEVGIVPPGGRPNHAWRHAFTTASRDVSMDKETRDYMMGSRSTTDAREGYGGFTPRKITAEINKLPRIDIVETDWRPLVDRVAPLALRGSSPTKRIRKPPNRRKKAPPAPHRGNQRGPTRNCDAK